jgi:PAS domain S-box-containing protein
MKSARTLNVLGWFALAVAGLIINAGVCYHFLVRLVDNSRRVVHSQQVLNDLEDTLSTVKDAETGQRGYLLTGRPEYLAPYEQARDQLAMQLTDLATLTADQPFFRERVPRLHAAIDAKMQELAKTIALHDREGKDAALAEVLSDRGREAMSEVRSLTAEMIAEETRRVAARGVESEASAVGARLTLGVATAVDLLLVAFVAILIQRDVTRRERHAEALRKSEEQLRLLVEGAQDYALVLLDRDGCVASWNSGAEQLFGYPSAAILGRFFSIFYPDGERDGPPSKHLAAAAGGGRSEEFGWRVRADGSRFWADAVLTPLRDAQGRRPGYALLTRDVTERRLAEEALQASESRFRQLADAGIIGIMTADFSGQVLEANDALLETVGHSRADLQGGTFNWSAITPPEYAAKDAQALEALRGSGVVEPYEKEFLRKDGSRVPVLIGAAKLRGAEDRCVCFVLDLTERKRAEEEVRQLNATLERRVEERTRQLRESNEELESFSYSVSHDLRAPLRHLSGFADLLQKRAADGLDENARRYTRIIGDAARNAGRLVDDLLAFSRMGRAEMTKAAVNMSELVAEVVRELESESVGRAVEWKIDALPTVPGDPPMLRQVVRNLLSNALKYTRSRTPATIHVGVMPASNGDEITFFVQDNGVGFDMRYVDKLFGVFQRLHTAEQFEGTGIGLANVRRIITRHGGRAWAEGTPGEGATIYFTLPVAGKEVRS